MTEARRKIERAIGAMRNNVWSELQHRRVAKRLGEATEPRQRTSRWWMAGAAGGLAVAAVAAVLVFHSTSKSPSASEAAPASQLKSARTLLSDGSSVDIDRGGQIYVIGDRPDETHIEVLAGRAEFEVQKRVGRPFIASIRGVEVRVVGTHFSTELDESRPPGLVRVIVARGVVEVSPRPGEPATRLNAGDKLEISLGPAAKPGDATNTVGAPTDVPSTNATPSTSVPPPPLPDASKLFEVAHDARRAGDVQAAVKAYATLLKQFPSDERVGVAAFELGRLRMDSQHAYGPAADAFRRAFAAAPNEGIREDALARLVDALDAVHDNARCLVEQQRYLGRYPKGVHATSVRTRCGSR